MLANENTLDDGVIFRNEGLAANILGLCQIQGEDWDNAPLVALLLDWITATLRALQGSVHRHLPISSPAL